MSRLSGERVPQTEVGAERDVHYIQRPACRSFELNQYNPLHWGGPMTLVLALKAKDGIWIAADKRETSYTAAMPTTDTASKIRLVARNCCIALSGNSPVGLTHLEEFERGSQCVEYDSLQDAGTIAHALYQFTQQRLALLDKGAEESLRECAFLVVGYTKGTTGKWRPCIKRLDDHMGLGFYPGDCVVGSVVSDSDIGFGTLGRDGLVYYYQQVLGISFQDLTVDELQKIGLFILAETAAATLDVGPIYDVFHMFEDSHSPIKDYSAALQAAKEAQEDVREGLRGRLAPKPHN